MLQFLEAFERRSWPCDPDSPYLLPFSKEQLREAGISSNEPTAS